MTVLETPRLKLRELTKADVPSLYQFFSDPETMRFYPSTRTYMETEEFVDRQLWRYRHDGYGPWGVILKSKDQFIGYCGLINQIVDNKHEVEIGYLISRNHWRNGFASEAAIGCRDYADERMKLTRVISLIDPLNSASIGVSRKVGMALEKQSEWQGKLMNVYAMRLR
jgi:RimJ/RimL family protein N-acetyltransferase